MLKTFKKKAKKRLRKAICKRLRLIEAPPPTWATENDAFSVDGNCIVCGGTRKLAMARWHKNRSRICYYHRCDDCGFLEILRNDWNYAEKGFTTKGSTVGPRVGREGHCGREYHMGDFGLYLLGRGQAEILIAGAGKSKDWRHLAERDDVKSVTTTDLENFCESPNFVALDARGNRTYDLVIACEVAEHFADPVSEIRDLCRDVSENGLMILSTNIYDGTDISRHWYPFILGHISYYSPESLTRLGEQNGMFVDFRVPKMALTNGGPRKRYVLFSRRTEILANANEYFAEHLYAPSE